MTTFETICCGAMLYIVIATLLFSIKLRKVARTAVYEEEDYRDKNEYGCLFINDEGVLCEQDDCYLYVTPEGIMCEGYKHLI